MSTSITMEKTDAQKNLEKSKVYRVMGFIFAVAGCFAFIIIYNRYMGGQPERIATHLPNLIAIIIPFLPSWLFFRMSQKHYDKAVELLQGGKATKAKAKAKK